MVKQTDWGIAPYSALFGALQVADEVEVVIDASSRPADPGRVAKEPDWPDSFESRAHLSAPIVDPRVSSVLWSLVFFCYLWLGMVAVGVSHGTALPLALMAALFILAFVRTRGAGRRQT